MLFVLLLSLVKEALWIVGMSNHFGLGPELRLSVIGCKDDYAIFWHMLQESRPRREVLFGRRRTRASSAQVYEMVLHPQFVDITHGEVAIHEFASTAIHLQHQISQALMIDVASLREIRLDSRFNVLHRLVDPCVDPEIVLLSEAFLGDDGAQGGGSRLYEVLSFGAIVAHKLEQ